MVWYCVSPAGMVTLTGPKPNEPSWKVDQSRFGSSCSVTVTSWAAERCRRSQTAAVYDQVPPGWMKPCVP